MTPARFRWGMLLIQIGILILMQNNDIINEDATDNLIIYLPVVLIAVGIEKIFTKSKMQFIAYLTTIALFISGFAIVFASANIDMQDNEYFSDGSYKEKMDSDLRLIKAKLYLDDNDLTIRDACPELIFAEFDGFSKKPIIKSTKDSTVANIYMQARENSFFGGAVKIHNGDTQDWNIKFSEDLPLDLKCEGYDNDFHLNFLNSRLQKLKLETDNSTIYLKIGSSEPFVEVIVIGEDSKLRLRVPEKTGIKVTCDDAEYFIRLGFEETDEGDFINFNYRTAENIIDFEVDENLLTFSVDYY